MDPVRGNEIGMLLLIILLILSHDPALAAEPIQVFLLAGQSNMVGHGSIDHLDRLIQEEPSSEYRNALWNGTQYITRKDVYVKFGTRHGYLTVHRTAGLAAPNAFGPELMLGITVGDAMPPQPFQPGILLLKTAYGGRSLAVDFRPPSAGVGNYTEVTNSSFYGWQYREMMAEIRDSLANLATYMPGYNGNTAGYELCGFVWFQGWNDVLDWAKVYEYESNLLHFIRDVRRDLHRPNLPFVVGELGMHGTDTVNDRALTLRAAQRKACAASNAAKFVPTAAYAVLNGTNYDGIHHYYGRADTIFHIGAALGKGMLELLSSDCDIANSSNVWINEFHYDNAGTDTNEFIEIAHTISLTGCQLQLYRAGMILYNNISLTGTVPNSTVDSIQYTVVEFPSANSIENGAPSGFVLADTKGNVVEFLSYEGILMHAASGRNSSDVKVMEDETTSASHSLQRCPDGDSNVWIGPILNTKGRPNGSCSPTSLPTPTRVPTPNAPVAPSPPVAPCRGVFGLGLFCFWSPECGWLERLFGMNGCSFLFS